MFSDPVQIHLIFHNRPLPHLPPIFYTLTVTCKSSSNNKFNVSKKPNNNNQMNINFTKKLSFLPRNIRESAYLQTLVFLKAKTHINLDVSTVIPSSCQSMFWKIWKLFPLKVLKMPLPHHHQRLLLVLSQMIVMNGAINVRTSTIAVKRWRPNTISPW